MKLLIVGDIHASTDSLSECERLVEFICETSIINNAEGIILMGDQFHNHSVVHLPVMKFWQDSIKKLKSAASFGRGILCALVGNHDRPGYENSSVHSMLLYDGITVVDDYHVLDESIVCIGYQFTNNKFLELCNIHNGQKLLLCHQTFQGCYYENGFYAKDGIESKDVPQATIISGHIHAGQSFDKVWYVGSPRWITASDANQSKGIWLVDIVDGVVKSTKFFSTETICTPIWHLEDRPETPLNIESIKSGKVYVDIYGPLDRVTQRKSKFEELGFRIRTFPIKNFISNIKESDGISNSFVKFVNEYTSKMGTSRERLLEIAEQRMGKLNG